MDDKEKEAIGFIIEPRKEEEEKKPEWDGWDDRYKCRTRKMCNGSAIIFDCH